MANNDSTNDAQLPLAFTAAQQKGFKLFFSFDYAGNGAWAKATVKSMITTYGSKTEYFKRGSQPLVSAFEGVGSAGDWSEIKTATKCFFIPDWSSVGAYPAVSLANGVGDGLFSWDAWPKGDQEITTYPGASYHDALSGKPYIMPISPIDNPADYVQIISWNEYGESHYIGPLDDKQYEAFDSTHGRAPFNYVKNMAHDGWRAFLPFVISLFKTGTASFNKEGITAWYRLNPNYACNNGGTTGNTANQLQYEFLPEAILKNRIFYTALLGSSANVGGVGLYHGSVPIPSGVTGSVVIKLLRGSTVLATITGAPITKSCTVSPASGIALQNYNAWVGSALSTSTSGPYFSSISSSSVCVSGFGLYDFTGLCSFSCHNG
ncbi:mutanase [Copromyces sp. CBS 386.78]|nr:mutanase [Copromyces sp. CBS 386.78]